MSKYKHLSLVEREKLFAWLLAGLSQRVIAKKLNRSQATLSRELKRNTKYGKPYIPCLAQKRYVRIGTNQRYKAPLKNPEVFLYVREHIRQGWSPETISGRLKLDIKGSSISVETIYNYIYSPKNRRYKLSTYLPLKRAKRKKIKSRNVRKYTKILNRSLIDNRAKYIQKRIQLGHWESDLLEGPRTSKQVLSVTVERSSRYVVLDKLPSKEAAHKTTSLTNKMKGIPAHARRTLTLDNGPENSYHQVISQQLNIKIYFCHPYHSWEKGSVENTIGRLRRYIPKGTELEKLSDYQISELEYILNNTPRKCLGYLTPYEKMYKSINAQIRA